METIKLNNSSISGTMRGPVVVGGRTIAGLDTRALTELARANDPSIRELSMFQNFGGRPISRGWVTPPQGKHHRANKVKKKTRKAQKRARRINR